MDVNTLRILLMLFCLGVFLVIVAWAWSGGRREPFAEAARLPLEDDAPATASRAHAGEEDRP